MIRPLIYCLCLAISFSAGGEEIEEADGAAYLAELNKIFSASHIPGAAVVVVREGQIAESWYYGFANLETKAPVTRQTVFRAGSVSKNITSLIAMRLMQAGQLQPEDSIRTLVPSFKFQNPWQSQSPLQLQHLLQHTGGLPGSSFAEYATDQRDASPKQYLNWLGPVTLRWPPGTFYSYANPGHTIAAAVLENVSGSTFDELALSQVFSPLGMQSASFATYGSDPSKLAKSYDASEQMIPDWEMMIRPSGSLTTNAHDLARLVAMYANGGLLSDGQPWISREWLKRMETGEAALAAQISPGAATYGWGNFGHMIDGHYFRGHWGKTEGFRTNIAYSTMHRHGFVILTNSIDERAMSAARKATARFLHKSRDIKSAPSKAIARVSNSSSAGSGWYINVGHEMPARQWLFYGLDQYHITRDEEDQSLQVERFSPQGNFTRRYVELNGGYATKGSPHATAAFADYSGDPYWLRAGPYKKVSSIEAFFWRYIAYIAIITSLLFLLQGIWLIVKRSPQGPVAQRLYPFIQVTTASAFLLACYLFLAFGLLGDAEATKLFGTFSLVSAITAVSSLLAGVLGILLPLIWWAGRPIDSRLHTLSSLVLWLPMHVLAWVWMVHDWVPLVPWIT
ncbi:MAG: serine hydrolase domain-containing protein [Pseudomonadota bacterium]